MPRLLSAPIVRIGVLVVVSGLVACGSGSVSSLSQNMPAGPSSTVSGTSSTTANTTLPPATTQGITATAQLPPASAAVTVTETVSVGVPSGFPPLDIARGAGVQAARRAQGSRTVLDTIDPLLYMEFTTTSSLTFDGSPGIAITLPSITAGASYYLAEYETSAWVAPVAGPGTISGSTVSFPLVTTGATTISPASPLLLALYILTAASPSPAASASPSASPSPIPSPIPSPSPSPSASPSPVPMVSPAVLTFDAGAPTTAPFTVSEAGETAAYTATITCATPAPSPSPSPGAPSPSPPAYPYVAQLVSTSATPTAGSATFSVMSGNDVGICSIVVTDQNGATVTETVDVDATVLGLYANHRKTR